MSNFGDQIALVTTSILSAISGQLALFMTCGIILLIMMCCCVAILFLGV